MQNKYIAKLFILILLVSISILPEYSWALSIRGQVLCQGTPVSRVRLYASNGVGVTSSAYDGSFSFDVPRSGTYVITPFLFGAYAPDPLSLQVDVGTTDVTGLEFEITPLLDSSISMISGRILDRNGPLAGVSVRLAGVSKAVTDQNGIYYILNVEPGRYYLSAIKDTHALRPSIREVKIRNERNVRMNFGSTPLPKPGTYSNNFAGVWNLSLRATSNVCPGIPATLEGQTIISQYGSRVKVYIPKLGYSIVRAGKNTFTGQSSFRRSFCNMDADLSGRFSTSGTFGRVNGKIKASCLFASPCQVEFAGTLKRQ